MGRPAARRTAGTTEEVSRPYVPLDGGLVAPRRSDVARLRFPVRLAEPGNTRHYRAVPDPAAERFEGVTKWNTAAAAGVLVTLPVLLLVLFDAPAAVSFGYLVVAVVILGAIALCERRTARETRPGEEPNW